MIKLEINTIEELRLLKSNIPVLEAFLTGNKIQFSSIKTNQWIDYTESYPNFTSNAINWRIKPYTCIPHTAKTAFNSGLLDTTIYFRKGTEYTIIGIYTNCVNVQDRYGKCAYVDYQSLLDYYTFENGEPVGQRVQ